MTDEQQPPDESFDPYRFGKPDYPIPPEYAPPGYVPEPTPTAPSQPHPYYGPSQYASLPTPPPYPGYPYGGYYPQPQQGGSGLAVASMVLGIISIFGSLLFFFDAPFVILAVVFGLISLNGKRPGRGMAIAGLACGAVGAVLAILTTVAINSSVQECGGWSHLGDPGFSDCLDQN